MRTDFCLRLVVLTSLVFAAANGSPVASAALIYQLVDYPALQNGYTLSGTITVADTAADDSILSAPEVLSWSWSVTGPGEMHASGNAPSQINSIVVTEDAILFSLDAVGNYPGLRLRDPDLTGRAEKPTLLWYYGFDVDVGLVVPLYTAGSATDVFLEAWSSRLFEDNATSYLVVARRVPEPSSLLVALVAVAKLSMLRRSRHT